MDSHPAENLILEAGKSDELADALALVADAQAPDGAPRYGAAACRALGRMIVCRTYAKPLLELVHLTAAAAAASPDGRYETLFWSVDRATAAAFKGAFDGAPGAEAEAVTVRLNDGEFTVTYSRMPALAALLEFLMTALGYGRMDEWLSPVSSGPISARQAGDAANGLSRALYDYLKDHLPPIQAQRRSRSFLEFIAVQGEGKLRPDRIDDAAVLEYWRARAGLTDDEDSTDTVDAKTYSGVFHLAVRLVKTLRAAQDRLAMIQAKPIGIDRESGEVDPAEIEDMLTAVEEAGDLLAPLDEPPVNAVKFLNGREREGLQDLTIEAGVGGRFPLSVMRNAVFGWGQATITNALRRNKDDLKTVIAAAPRGDYAAHLEALSDLSGHLDRMLLACYRVLTEAGRAEAAGLAQNLDSDLDLSALAPEPDGDGAVVSLDAHRALSRFREAALSVDGPLGPLNEKAAAALKGLARQGFRPADRTEPHVIDGFANAPGLLRAIKQETEAFLNGPAAADDWAARFAQDKQIFTETFETLYGVQHA